MPRNKEYDREEVLEKAMQTFWSNGYEQTSVRLLEKEMGINQFSIYSSFANKNTLFIESLRKYREHVKKNVYKDLLKPGARIKDLEQYMNKIAENIQKSENRGCLVVNTTGEMNEISDEIAAELNNYYMFIRGMIKTVLLNSIEAGDIQPETDVEKYSSFFLGIMQGLSVGSKVLPADQIRDIIKVSLSVLK